MKAVPLDFSLDPSKFAVSYLQEHGLDISKTLIITPTERFKVYMAQAYLDTLEKQAAVSPVMIKIGDLVEDLTAFTNLPSANEIERLNFLYRACIQTKGFDDLFGAEILTSFSSFQRLASSLLGSFDEINRMEIDLEEGSRGDYYRLFKKHFDIFRDIYENYRAIQQEHGIYDTSFLLERVEDRNIEEFFSRYENVLFIAPLLLTHFERRVFETISDKLCVIYQDTDEYDFSRLITFGGSRGAGKLIKRTARKGSCYLYETSTRIETVMLVMSLITRELDRGVEPHRIAVINIDPLTCEMIKRSCDSIGVAANYTRGIQVTKSPIFVFLRLISDFFDSRMDTDILLQIARSEFFCELSGQRDHEELRKNIVRKRVFALESLQSSLLDIKSRRALEFLQELYRSKTFDALYNNLVALFQALGGRRPFEFYTVRDILLEAAIELTVLNAIDKSLKFTEFEEISYDIFLQYSGGKRYPVKGSMRQGVQIIGLLETRGVNFRTTIVPTFNEGYFPTSPGQDLVFSSELKKALGLSTITDREKLEFYYLKRLLSSSERSFIIPIRESVGDFDVPSRYTQIMPTLEGESIPYTLPVSDIEGRLRPEMDLTPVLKSRSESERIYSRFDIHRLKRCEVQYYIAHILKIEGERVLSRKIEMDIVGLKVHGLMRDIYREMDFDNLPSPADFEKKAREMFMAYFHNGLFGTSEEVFMRRILSENITESLRCDYERFRSGTVVCKEWLEKEFAVETGGYRLTGRIDRIDRSGEGKYTILDYKTGKLPEMKDHLPEGDYMEVQLGFYGLLFKRSFPEYRINCLGYFDLSRNKDIVTVVDGEEAEQYIDDFERHLLDFLDDFEQTDELSLAADVGNCTYCPYYTICRIYDT
ncbi:MAG: PD-(D/E)XK nuclease family protein [Spirochaetota bacterium]|nr:MAG: PD-(D/E)XK nuclease family protein [Spirochaetota bacterium]